MQLKPLIRGHLYAVKTSDQGTPLYSETSDQGTPLYSKTSSWDTSISKPLIMGYLYAV